MLLSLVLVSAAHLPHDNVKGVAVPEDFEEVGRAHALVQVDGRNSTARGWTLLETTDGGARWNPMPVPGWTVDPTHLVDWAGHPMLWAAEGARRLDGEQWVEVVLPSGQLSDAQGGGTGMAIAGNRGLWWASSLESSWENLVPGASFVAVEVSADGSRIAGIDQSGQIYLGDEAAVEPLPLLEAGHPVALALADALYVATADVISVWMDGQWRPCAELPASSLTNGMVPVRLAAHGAALVVGTGQDLAFSDDRCQTFQRQAPFPDAVSYVEEPGAVQSLEGTVTTLWLGDHTTVVGGYRGIAVQPGRQASYQRPRMWDGGFVRDLAWDVAADLLFATNYGDGLQRYSSDGMQSLGGEGMRGPDTYGRVVGWLRPDHLLYAGDLGAPLISEDGGVSWSETGTPAGEIRGLWRAGGQSWVMVPEVGLFRSRDGQVWTPVEAILDTVVAVREGHLLEEEGFFVVTSAHSAHAYFLSDAADPQKIVGPQGAITALVSWPPGGGQRLIAGDRRGIASSEDGGESFERVLELPGGVLSLVVADDGTLFAVDAADGLWRSHDGGDRWTLLPIPLPPIQEIEVAPDFAERELVVAGTLLGLYWSDDQGDSWHEAGHADVLLAQDVCLEPFSPTARPRVVERVLILGPGEGVAPWTLGSSVTVEGAGEGRMQVELEGERLGEVKVGEVLALPGTGWRQLRIEVVEGEVGLKRISMPFEGEPLPSLGPAPAGPPGCGCGQGGAAGLLLPLVARRRRR